MASLLRQIVAGPRNRHREADLDLCYITDNIIATSGPSESYPQRAYRNPLDDLVKFLDSKHKDKWAIWEFRAEGTGYPDEAVYNRVWHYPWPDHHPPPFHLIPNIMASMRDWLKGAEGRVVVVHCKAGKGRSGTASCSYLVSEEGWSVYDALAKFTERRMRPGWGQGVSIPSQLRWLGYVDRWKQGEKLYVERKVEVTEVHVWGLRDGVTVAVRGFIDEGKTIKVFHLFTNDERDMVRGEVKEMGFADAVMEIFKKPERNGKPIDSLPSSGRSSKGTNSPRLSEDQRRAITKNVQPTDENKAQTDGTSDSKETPAQSPSSEVGQSDTPDETADATFRPKKPILIPTNDINIDCERRTKGAYTFGVTTSIAHVWFNTFFEGGGAEKNGLADDSGVFEINFDQMDGIKGSTRRGTKCFDRLAVVWKATSVEAVVEEPKEGEEVKMAKPADWRGANPVPEKGDGHNDSETEDEGTKPTLEE